MTGYQTGRIRSQKNARSSDLMRLADPPHRNRFQPRVHQLVRVELRIAQNLPKLRRINLTGSNGIHAHSLFCPFHGQLSGQSIDPGFRRSVGTGPATQRYNRRDRRNVDYASAALLDHSPAHQLAEQKRTAKVDVDRLFPVVQGEFDRRFKDSVAGQIDQDVDPPEFRQHVRNGLLDLYRIPNIASHREGLGIGARPDCLGCGGCDFFGDIEAGNVRSRIGEALANRQANGASRASDQRGLSG